MGLQLPRTARTLLKSPAKINIRRMSPGFYAHYGILKAITYFDIPDDVKLLSFQFFIDGLEVMIHLLL